MKNWFAGRYGPSSEHLVSLVRHPDEALGAFLVLAGRQDLMLAVKLATAEQAIEDLLTAVRQLGAHGKDGLSE